ncbi:MULTISPECIES: hypothetical protein [unclassified Streptomyces]
MDIVFDANRHVRNSHPSPRGPLEAASFGVPAMPKESAARLTLVEM